jgi:hypothetical protein
MCFFRVQGQNRRGLSIISKNRVPAKCPPALNQKNKTEILEKETKTDS